ncbi:hypothetical protein BaRGS_00022481 [Batillaria attramentaria]|uniref:Uncharacterized protein n=1 Tax=Batillaria attramentaria TaxID=370345 RepID=A0ABD0KGI8_9CAEN
MCFLLVRNKKATSGCCCYVGKQFDSSIPPEWVKYRIEVRQPVFDCYRFAANVAGLANKRLGLVWSRLVESAPPPCYDTVSKGNVMNMIMTDDYDRLIMFYQASSYLCDKIQNYTIQRRRLVWL